MSDISSTPTENTAVLLKNIAVKYRIPNEPIHTFKEYIIRTIKGQINYHEFWALKGIDLEVKKGEIFGIIGRNGAGKSTLLKVISRVLIPSEGRVLLRGDISPLLQLGAGFHPELTGLENIRLNATILGHTRNEIEEKMEEIIDFSEIGEFVNVPLRTYSSGMRARLGFAVATAWKPDILLLDEVLSVGDVAFRDKCFERMEAFRQSDATVILVTHSIQQVRNNCQRAMWLDEGKIRKIGATRQVCKAFREAMKERRQQKMKVRR